MDYQLVMLVIWIYLMIGFVSGGCYSFDNPLTEAISILFFWPIILFIVAVRGAVRVVRRIG